MAEEELCLRGNEAKLIHSSIFGARAPCTQECHSTDVPWNPPLEACAESTA